MLRLRPKLRPVLLLLPAGLGLVLLVLLVLGLGAGHPVQAQPPADEPFPPELMMMDPRGIDQDARLKISVNYAADIIEEGYPDGETVWITVTNAAGDVKATAELQSQQISWWAPGQTGFSTSSELGDDPWEPAKPDIVPGDWVSASSSLGDEAAVRVGDITAHVDVATDVVTGTIDATWLLDDDLNANVEVKCRAYDPATGADEEVFDEPQGFTIPDGTDIFTCDFGAAGWELNPGHLIAISYDALGPDVRGDRILNVYRVPGPYLQVRHWAPGSPGAGGNLVLNVEVRNNGTEPATNVQLTQIMTGLTFIESTSDAPLSGSGAGPIVWNLGTVPVDSHWTRFQIFAEVTANAGATVASTAALTSDPPENMGAAAERTKTWQAQVRPATAWLSVNKNAWTRYPVPGTEFVYTLNVCNAANPFPADSSYTTLTDTLPAETTFVDWWGEGGWSVISQSDNELVLSRPSIPASNCTEVFIRVALHEGLSEGYELCNSAVVEADNNATSTVNSTEWCHNVGAPQPNLAINKEWACGELVPGGRLIYNVMVQNTGNVPIEGPILMTDTLPPFTTLNSDNIRLYENQPFTFTTEPVSTADGEIVWELGQIDSGYWTKFKIELDIAETVPVGTWLTNTIAIGKAGLIEAYEVDNVSSWTERINPSGPNLRVDKVGAWNDWGDNTRRLSYNISVENVGDETVYNAVLTDTYDSRLHLDGAVHIDWTIGYQLDLQPDSHFTIDFDALAPGQAVGISFGALASTEAVTPGLAFTNTAEITLLPTDTDPTDNISTVVHTSGPDLSIKKEFYGGLVAANEEIIYNIPFGNARGTQVWWWGTKGDVLITDTLPVGMTFVSSQLEGCGATEFRDYLPISDTDGAVVWKVDPLPTGTWCTLRVTAQMPDTATRGQSFTNRVDISSTEPAADADAQMANNVATTTIWVGGVQLDQAIYLPLVMKATTP